MAFKRLKRKYNRLKTRYNDWYNEEYYPRVRRKLNYYLSFDVENIKKSLRIRNIPHIIKNPDVFVGYFIPKSLTSLRDKLSRELRRRKEYPEKLSQYKKMAADLEKTLSQVQAEKENYMNLYAELDISVEAAKAKVAAANIGSLENKITTLKKINEGLARDEQEVVMKYGQTLEKINYFEREVSSLKQSSFKRDEIIKKVLYNEQWLEAIIEDEARKHTKILGERDRLIGLLRRSAHERETRFVEGYFKEILNFANKHPGGLLVIGPGLEGAIIDATDDAKEILNYNGDLVGRKYSEVLALDSRGKREALVYFSRPEEQEGIVPVVDRKGKKYNVKVANKPIMSKIPGEENNHLFTIVSINSVGWWENRYGSSRAADLKLRLEEQEERRRKESVEKEKTRQLTIEAGRMQYEFENDNIDKIYEDAWTMNESRKIKV
jgi:hypothetical protein